MMKIDIRFLDGESIRMEIGDEECKRMLSNVRNGFTFGENHLIKMDQIKYIRPVKEA
ncbi:hypothetical protein MO973_19900 [Paenibacillus sp. TRM 82003]|nr:hypothetical protein [Paenibacillus sp. TRM 82003]